MKLNGFREILLKKSSENKNLQSFIYHMKDDYLVDYVFESLEKMAANKGGHKKPNLALMSFAKGITPGHADMIHDALSHHATKYKSALEAGDNKVAGQHMNKFFKTVHMLDKVLHDGNKNHTDGALTMDVVDPKPWERNRYQGLGSKGESNPYKQDHYATDTKGWDRDVADYSYLQQSPHHSYVSEVHGHGHNKAYPIEETKINGKHIDIDHKDKFTGKFEPHPFDSHPIFQNYKKTNENLSGPNMVQHMMDSMNFDMNNFKDFMSSHNPAKGRGEKKSAPVHKDVAPLDIDKHLPLSDPKFGAKAAAKQSAQVSAPSKKIEADEPPPIPAEVSEPSGQMEMGLEAPSKADVRSKIAEIRSKK